MSSTILRRRRATLEGRSALELATEDRSSRARAREMMLVKADTEQAAGLDEQARMDAHIGALERWIWARHIEWDSKLTKVVTKERQIVDEETGSPRRILQRGAS